MHVMLVADGRSPTTRGWIRALQAIGNRVTLVSTYPCDPIAGVQDCFVLPVALGNLAGSQAGGRGGRRSGLRKALGRSRNLVLGARYWLGPLTVPYYAKKLKKIAEQVKPDLTHALRIPFEGMLLAAAQLDVPMAVSIWGNDLTLHARGSRWMAKHTTATLRRANGLLADAQRDIRLGKAWGFSPQRASMVLPGAGGIDLVEMHRIRSQAGESLDDLLHGITPRIPDGAPLVINPRGFRPGSVRNDTFFESVPLTLERRPDIAYLCTGMAGQAEAIKALDRHKLHGRVHLLPLLPQAQLWNLFERAAIMLSVSSHDGTPNSLLEAMACGAFPIAGDIESLREWITPGVNGLLVEPHKPQSLADAVLTALDNPDLLSRAQGCNLRIIRERAESELVRSQIGVFYWRVLYQT